MSQSSSLQSILYDTESAWCEASSTFTKRLPIISKVDPSGLIQPMIEKNIAGDRKQFGTSKVPGPKSGEIKTSFHLFGHGSTTAGAVTISDMATLLGHVFGNSVVSAASGTTLTGGTVNIPTTTASNTFADGALCRIGALGDGDGNGQAYAIATHVGNDLTLLTNLPATPAAAAVLYSGDMVWSTETAPVLQSYRILFQSAGKHFSCRGCFPKAVTITSLNAGEVPVCEITWGVSDWDDVTTTFPSAVSMPTVSPAPNTAGSCWFGDYGVATYGSKTLRSFQLDYTLGVKEVMAMNTAGVYQTISAAYRTPDTIKLTMVVDAETASASPAESVAWLANAEKHTLLTFNSYDGKCVAMYFPRICYSGNRPTQADVDGLNRQTLEFTAYESGSGTTDLERSAFRMLLA